jgi:hypothetical protein
MKKLLLTLALAAITTLSYGQGTVQFQNGNFTRVTLVNALGVNVGNVPVGTQLSFGLFAGADAASMSQLPIGELGAMGTVAGIFLAPNGLAYAVPNFPAASRPFLQVRAWSSSFSDWREAKTAFDNGLAGTMYGETDIRQIGTLGLGPNSGPGAALWQTAAQTNPNLLNPLVVRLAVPEPSTIALGVLGLGSLLLFRRRQAK